MLTRMAKVIDLDRQVGDSEEPIHTVKIKLFQREWDVVCDVNSYALTALSSGDVEAYRDYLVNSVIDEQRSAMKEALLRQRGLTAERFMTIINAVMEVVMERPTKSASASSRTPTKRTSAPRSTGGSSKARVSRSTR